MRKDGTGAGGRRTVSMVVRAIALGVLMCGAGAGEGRAGDAVTYGAGVSGTSTVKIGELLSRPDQHVGAVVRVEGKVTGVCPMMGCWIEIAGEEAGEAIRFKVQDGEIVFPLDVPGKHVVAEGKFTKFELSRERAVARARHLAEEKGEPFDPSSVTGPVTVYQIQGTGAVVR